MVTFTTDADLSSLFDGCKLCTSINLTGFDTSEVINMSAMFMCDSIKEISALQSITFGNKFNTSKVVNMSYMFSGLFNLTSLDLTTFDTSNVTDMSAMFVDCSKITTLDLTAFNTSKVIDMNYMFMSSWVYDNTKSSTLEKIIFGDKFNTSEVTSMIAMFYACKGLTSIDLSKFNTSNVKNMDQMFNYCSSLIELDLSNFDTSNVTSMSGMFDGCDSLTFIKGLDKFSTSKVTNTSRMFQNCYALLDLNLESFDLSNITKIEFMFFTCKSLETLNLGSQFNLSKLAWNDGKLGSMFYGCAKLKSIKFKNCTINNYLNLTDI